MVVAVKPILHVLEPVAAKRPRGSEGVENLRSGTSSALANNESVCEANNGDWPSILVIVTESERKRSKGKNGDDDSERTRVQQCHCRHYVITMHRMNAMPFNCSTNFLGAMHAVVYYVASTSTAGVERGCAHNTGI